MKKLFYILTLCLCGSLIAQETPSLTVTATNKSTFDSNPYVQLQKVIDSARAKGVPFAHAGVLATADATGTPYARVMDISKLVPEGIVFFSNKDSGKWKHMTDNQKASFVLYYHDYAPNVVMNGTIDLNYADQRAKDYSLIINGKNLAFKWGSFLFKPTSIQFTDESLSDGYRVGQSYVYKKGPDGNWTLSDSVKYYATPVETGLYQK